MKSHPAKLSLKALTVLELLKPPTVSVKQFDALNKRTFIEYALALGKRGCFAVEAQC